MSTNRHYIFKSLFITLFLFVGFSMSLFSTEITNASEINKKIEQIEKNIQIIKNNIETNNDSLLDIIRKTLYLSIKSDYLRGIESSHFYLGRFYQLRNEYDSSLYYYKIGIEKAKIEDKSNLLTSYYIGISNILWETGEYSDCLEISLEAKNYFEAIHTINERFEIFNLLGLCYNGLLEYELAILNLQKSAQIAISKGIDGFAGVVYANIGKVYFQLENYDSSLYYFKKGVMLEEKNNLYINAGRSYSTLALIYLNQNKNDSSKIFLEKAYSYNINSNDNPGLVRTYIAYGKFYTKLGNFKESIYTLNKALPIATKYQSKIELIEIYNLLAQNNKQIGNYNESNFCYEKYIEFYQKVYDVKKINHVKTLEHQLKISSKQNEINLLNIQKQKSTNILLLVIVVLLLIISALSIVFVIYFKNNNKKLIKQNLKISEQKEILEELNKQLILAEENFSKVDELKSNFINILSHEIRTPLNGIVGFSSLAFDSEITQEERIEASKIIKKSSDDLISTIEGLVEISLVNSNQLYVYKVSFNVYSFMNKIYDDFINMKSNSNKDHVILNYYPDKNFSTYKIIQDSILLKKIMYKLMNNAIKYTAKGKVEFGFSITDYHITFFVSDTGIGIHEESFQKIFIPFEKGDNVPKNSGGLGISLSLVKKYIELLDGRMWFESVVNKGSKFYFEVPFQ